MNETIEILATQAGLNYHINADVYYEWDKGGISLEMMKRLEEIIRKDERKAIIDIVTFNGGSVEIEVAIRQRGEV